MRFAYPEWAWLTGLAAAAALFAVLALVRRRLALRRLAGPGAAPPRRWLRWAKALLLVAAAALLGVALLGPEWGYTEEENAAPPARGRDLLVVLDVSRSMLAQDVAPSRLERAKADVQDLADALEKTGGWRVGLITFADRASLLCPLTSDYRCFAEELASASLGGLRLRGGPEAEDGTQIAAALRRAAKAIDPKQAAYTDVLLVSDGDDMATETLAAADELGKMGVAVHALGLGDPVNGATIPVIGADGRPTVLRYQGEPVRTKFEEAVLRAVTERTGGRCLAVGTRGVDLPAVFREVVAEKQSRELKQPGRARRGIPRFQWFLLPAVALLLLELLPGDGRRAASGAAKPQYFRWVRRRPATEATAV
jgi:Ca-activated chloride channel family protein